MARFNPSGLINIFDANISLGADYRFKRKWSAALDASWIFYSINFSDAKHTSGIILRPAVRYYVGAKLRRFIEGELHYKNVAYRFEDWLGRDCVNNIPAYEEFTNFRYLKQEYGFHIKTGILYALGNASRFFIEIYAGVGLHHRIYKIKDKPDGCLINRDNFFGRENYLARPTYVALPTGGRLVYRMN